MAVQRDRPYAGMNFHVDLGLGDGPDAGVSEVLFPAARLQLNEYRNGNDKVPEAIKRGYSEALDQARNGEGCTLVFSYSKPGADDALTFTVRNVRFSRPRREVTGPAGVQISLDWIAGKHSTGSSAMVTAVLVNSRESY